MDPNANPYPRAAGLPPARELLASPDAWTPELFRRLNFIAGLEIHQQIQTEKKLFCHCDARLQPGVPAAARVFRHMRPTLSEMGTYDGTALMEFKTRKQVIYELLADVVCTYEMDDTPPFLVNDEALDKAIQLAMIFNCSLVDELHITRKQYLDGSIPTGFQRTAIIGINGWVPFKDGRVRIRQVALEEDACREVSDIGHEIVFRTDRLGFPLIEIVTEPDAGDPWELEEIGRLLGDILRGSGLVRRGLGATRQDVNVSIGGSTRVETKGVPRIGYFPQLTAAEALRHLALMELADELQRRGLAEAEIETRELSGKIIGAPDTTVGIVRLPGWGGLLDWPTQPDFTFLDELRGLVRVVACLPDFPYVLAENDRGPWSLTGPTWDKLRREAEARPEDTILAVRGEAEDVRTALGEIRDRCRQAAVGVPDETRQALVDERTFWPDGRELRGVQTDFERVLPGADRMYPDTDHPPQAIPAARRERLRQGLPEPLWERRERLQKLGLAPDIIRRLSRERREGELFDRLVLAYPALSPLLIGETMVRTATHLRRKGYDIPEEVLEAAFDAVAAGTVAAGVLPRLLSAYGRRPEEPLPELIAAWRVPEERELEDAWQAVTGENHGPADPAKRRRYLLGRLQDRLGERASAGQMQRVASRLS